MKKLGAIFNILILTLLLVACVGTIDSYTITFETNGGTPIEAIEADANFDLASLEALTTKEGYEFDGWYTNISLDPESIVDEAITGSITLYAKWNIINYTITYHLDGGSNHLDNPSSYTILDEVVLKTPTKEGYTFNGWLIDNDTTKAISQIQLGSTNNLSLYATWEATTETSYVITWKQVDGTTIKTTQVLEGLLPVFDGATPTKPSDDAFDYAFAGWTPSLGAATKDQTYTATFTATAKGKADYNPAALNAIFGFDIYALMPNFSTNDSLISNLSEGGLFEVYIDIFDWKEADANAYMDLLDAALSYDDVEQSWVIGNYYLYVFEDAETYPGEVVYGIGIYSLENGPVDPEEPGALETLDYQQSINAYEKQKFGISGLPSVGTFDVLVIPVEISGSPFDLGYQEKLDVVFNGTAQSTGWQSVSSYYTLSSFGRLNLSFDIAPKFVTSNTRSYYENLGQGGDQHAIVESLNGLDSQIDYSKYDSNNDGYIDSVVFIYSVDYDYDQDPWWAWVYSAKYGQAKNIGKLDGKNFEYYFWASYSFLEDPIQGNSGLIYNAETYIHELGHLMGMVDFYPYEGNNDYGPMGGFDMMDYNVGDHGPFTKLVFGWLKPLLATTGAYDVTLDSYALDTDGEQSVLLIPYSGSNLEDGNAFDEYLLIMFYTPKGLYQGHLGTSTVPTLPGVVIYHVDGRTRSNETFWGDYFINDNEGSSNFINQILEADKNQSIPGSVTFRVSDMLTSGSIDLSTYQWNQGGNINVSISIQSTFNANSENVTLSVTVQ